MAEDKDKAEERRTEQLRELGHILWGERMLVATVVISAFGLAAFAMWLMHKQREQAQLAQLQMQRQLGLAPGPEMRMLPAAQPTVAQHLGGAPAALQMQAVQPAIRGLPQDMQTAMLTMALPTDRATRLWQPPMQNGPPRYWRVVVRNIGPAGSFAVISMDSGGSAFNSVQIPAGIAGTHEFQVGPSQVLYGRGTREGVEITLSASST